MAQPGTSGERERGTTIYIKASHHQVLCLLGRLGVLPLQICPRVHAGMRLCSIVQSGVSCLIQICCVAVQSPIVRSCVQHVTEHLTLLCCFVCCKMDSSLAHNLSRQPPGYARKRSYHHVIGSCTSSKPRLWPPTCVHYSRTLCQVTGLPPTCTFQLI